MPASTAPAWFDYEVYFDNKLAELQRTEPDAGWDIAKLQQAFLDDGYAVDGEGMYRHFNEYGNTIAENVSPNAWFDVDYYMGQKLAQMQATMPGYTMAMLQQAFENANLTAWNHYTLYGMYEGINPSADFNTNAYMHSKLRQMQSSDESYTDAQLDAAFRAAGLNPIEHWFLYGQYEGLNYTPGGDIPLPDVTYPLTPGQDNIYGQAAGQVFSGTVDGSDAATLNYNDMIAGSGSDTLIATLAGASFDGFSDGGFMKGVPTVYVVNNGEYGQTFDASGVSGVQTYNLDGQVALQSVSDTGITVSAKNAGDSISVQFDENAVAGSADAMTLAVTDAGASDDAAEVYANGIENLTVNATGASFLDLTQVENAKSLAVTGSGDLTVTAVANSLTGIDASAATGDVSIDASKGGTIRSATLGAGDDTLTVGANLFQGASVKGGEGDDTLEISGISAASVYQLQMSGVETLAVSGMTLAAGAGSNVAFSGKQTSGMQHVLLDGNSGTGNIQLTDFNGVFDLTANGANANTVQVVDQKQMTLTVGDGKMGSDGNADSSIGAVTLDAAQQVKINLQEDAIAGTLTVNANKATQLTVDSDADVAMTLAGSFTSVNNAAFTALGDVTVTAALGGDAKNIKVDGSDVTGDFTAGIAEYTGDESSTSATLIGSGLGQNTLTVGAGYARVKVTSESVASGTTIGVTVANDADVSINLTGTIAQEAITITQEAAAGTITLTGDLGGGTDSFTYAKTTGTTHTGIWGDNVSVAGLSGYSEVSLQAVNGARSTLTGGSGTDTFVANTLATPAVLTAALLGSSSATTVVNKFTDGTDKIDFATLTGSDVVAINTALSLGSNAFESVEALMTAITAETATALAASKIYWANVGKDTVLFQTTAAGTNGSSGTAAVAPTVDQIVTLVGVTATIDATDIAA